ncbi:MAG: DUF2889 domain-containing protein [Betaproteobacteria bacterium]|nr:MAG: DUF2889 domain-containing protein [Betaproteobacteria bacterium]
MPLPTPATRERLHLRRVSYEGFRRDDGLFDIEAKLIDTKDHAYPLATGERSADQPVHLMSARVTINTIYDVLDIAASTDEMPYPGHCSRITPDYRKLIGANLMRGFRKAISAELGGVKGCTHLSELLAFLPTAAVQTFAGLKRETDGWAGKKPFQLDACHALDTRGEAVKIFYPTWFVAENATTTM